MVQTVGVGVIAWGIFSWHALHPSPEHCLNARIYLRIFADHFHVFMSTVRPATCHKAHDMSKATVTLQAKAHHIRLF